MDGREILATRLQQMIRDRSTQPVVALASRARQVIAGKIYLRHCTSVGAFTQLKGQVRVNNEGAITIGSHVRFHATILPIELMTMAGGILEIGDNTFVNYGVSISCHKSIRIGHHCLLGTYVNIMDNSWHDIQDRKQFPPSRPVLIEDNVWLGNRVIILPGVTIGHDAVVGAGAVVAKDIPPRSVAVGVPAQVVRSF